MKTVFRLVFLLAILSAGNAYAFTSIGGMADNLMGPTDGLIKLMHGVCFLLGIGFLLGGLLQVKNHRDNPQQVKISTPITLILLGLAIMALPWLSVIAQTGFSVV